MLTSVKMLGRVFVFRAVAAADVPAREAQSQVNPIVATLQTLFAAIGMGCNRLDLIKMSTVIHF